MVVVSTVDEGTGNSFFLSSRAKEIQNVAYQLYEAELKGFEDGDILELQIGGELNWEPVRDDIEELLLFLVGSRAKLSFAQSAAPQTYVKRFELARPVPTVSLFSGGLDSSAFAVYLGQAEPHSILSHTETSYPIYGKARKFYSNFVGGGVGLVVSRVKSEISQWGMINTRGIVFLSNALVIALELGARRVVVPENGPMMLNIPVSSQVYSSKTANLDMIREWTKIVNDVLGVRIVVETPYGESTKAEIVRKLGDPKAVAQTYSCFGSQGQSRMCGLCLACFVRIASCYAAGLPEDIDSTYAHNPYSETLSSLGPVNQDKMVTLMDALDFWTPIAEPSLEEVSTRRRRAEGIAKRWPVMKRHALDILLGAREYVNTMGSCDGEVGRVVLELLGELGSAPLEARKEELNH